MLPSKWKSDIGFWETLFSHTFPLKNSRYFRQLSVLLSEMIPLLLTTSIYFSSSQRKQYICWNVTNKQASRWFERIVATIASNELLNFDILECTFMSVRCFANVTLDIFGMIPWVSFLFFFHNMWKTGIKLPTKNSQSFSKYSAELERESQFCWLSAQKKLFSVEHDTGRKFLWITFLGERKREVSTNWNMVWSI